MADTDKKVDYLIVKGCEDCTVHADKKYVLKDCSQKELGKLFKLGVKEVATK